MQSVNRKRRWLARRSRLLGLALVFVLLIAGCTTGAPAPSTEQPAAEATSAPAEEAPAAESEEVTRENTLIFAADASDLLTLDPAVVYEFGGIAVVGFLHRLQHVAFGGDEIAPHIPGRADLRNGVVTILIYNCNDIANTEDRYTDGHDHQKQHQAETNDQFHADG